jgi:hypothetical protein
MRWSNAGRHPQGETGGRKASTSASRGAIQRLKEVEGSAGFHVMAIEWEEKVPEIVERAGLYPGYASKIPSLSNLPPLVPEMG